jgi:ribosomal protein S18 acetylase RimI-like enzyme
MVKFRLYEENDYPDLLEMIISLYREDPEGQPIDEEKIRRTIAESRNYPEKLSIYMFSTGKVNIGYAILVYFWSNEYGGNIITIDELYVKEPYRSQGIGTEFLAFAERLENKAALQLETTPSNSRVLGYYKRLGFVPSENTHLMRIDNKSVN